MAASESTTTCVLCAEEVTELVALLRQVPLGEELAAAYATTWPPRLSATRAGDFRPLSGVPPVDEAEPVLADESSTGDTWAHFEALEWVTTPGPREATRLQVVPTHPSAPRREGKD
jgi:hypothetical protein